MATANVNGTNLFYELVGDGQVFVVMHGGLGADHTMYKSLDPLAQARRLLYYDHRGNGRSGRPALETLTMEQLADDAASLIAQITDEKVILFGHSYGGFVAQEFALRHPDRLGLADLAVHVLVLIAQPVCDALFGGGLRWNRRGGDEQSKECEAVHRDDPLRAWVRRFYGIVRRLMSQSCAV